MTSPLAAAHRIVVTGASGYLGQHLVPRLAADGWVVTALTRHPDGSPFAPRLGRFGPAQPVPVTPVRGDVTDYGSLTPHLQGVHAVVHLACLPLGASGRDPRGAFATNTLGTFNVLEACRENGVRRVVVTSSAYVYGLPLEVPMTEHHPTFPSTPYGASKLGGDAFALAYDAPESMRTAVLRIFNVFGPAADGTPRPTVDSTFRKRAQAGLPVTIHGNPADAHDFVHVLDVVDAVTSALSPSAAGVYNIGSGRACSLRALALAAGVDENLIQATGDQTRPAFYQADIARAKRDLGFRPRGDVIAYVSSPSSRGRRSTGDEAS